MRADASLQRSPLCRLPSLREGMRAFSASGSRPYLAAPKVGPGALVPVAKSAQRQRGRFAERLSGSQQKDTHY